MRKYTLSFADSFTHVPKHPGRTAKRNNRGLLDFDVTYQVWPNRESMLKTIELQSKRAPQTTDWKPCIPK